MDSKLYAILASATAFTLALSACDSTGPVQNLNTVSLVGASPSGLFGSDGGDFRILIAPVDESGEVITGGVSESNFSFSDLEVTPTHSPADIVSYGTVTAISVETRQPGTGEASGVALTFDASGSMTSEDPNRLSIEAGKLVVDLLRDNDQAAVLDFATAVTIRQELTSDKDLLRAAIDDISFGGQTALYQAAVASVDLLEQANAPNPAVILFADGGNNRPGTLIEAVDRANAANIPIFAVGLGSSSGLANLRQLAAEANGSYVHADDAEALAQIFSAVGFGVLQGMVTVHASGVLNPPISPGAYRVSGTLTTTIGGVSVDTPFSFLVDSVSGAIVASAPHVD